MRKIAVILIVLILMLVLGSVCQAATIKAAQAGNWSDPNTWVGLVVPVAGDTADLNGLVVAMDINTIPTVGSSTDTLLALTSAGTAGQLTVNLNAVGPRRINAATMQAGTNNTGLISVTGTTYPLATKGNLIGGSTVTLACCLRNNNAGTINHTGNATGGDTSYAYGIYNVSSGAINFIGNVSGGPYYTAFGILNYSVGIITITGNLIFSDSAPPYLGYRPVLTAGSQYYIQIAGIKFPQQLLASQVLAGVAHGDITGTLPILRKSIMLGN